MERPEYVKKKHLEYLDALRKTGVTNMWGAVSWVENAFPKLSKAQASEVHSYWMKTFGQPTR